MRKLIVAAVMVALAFPGLALAIHSTDQPESEKIPSPEYLEFFKVKEQKGNALWGHRLMSWEEMKAKLAEKKAAKMNEKDGKKTDHEDAKADKKDAKEESWREKKLEKIATPQHIKFFDGVRQVGSSLWGYVKDSWSYGLGLMTKGGAACVAAATGTRDASVRAAIVANDAALLAAYDARSSCQQAAFTKDTAKEIAAALVKCNGAFETSRKDAWKAFLVSRDSAWKQFRADLKKCGEIVNASMREADADTQDVIEALDDEALDDVIDDGVEIED